MARAAGRCGVLNVDDPKAEPDERRYALPAAHRPVFAHEEDLNYLTPPATLAIGVIGPIEVRFQAVPRGIKLLRTEPQRATVCA